MHVPKVAENVLMHKFEYEMQMCNFVSQDLTARGIYAFYDAAKRNKVVYTEEKINTKYINEKHSSKGYVSFHKRIEKDERTKINDISIGQNFTNNF